MVDDYESLLRVHFMRFVVIASSSQVKADVRM
jgi:hypothetical protein